MKIVIAPDSFKESLTAIEAAQIIEDGFKEILPDACYLKMPLADGGEGTLDTLLHQLGGERITTQVTSPSGQTILADFGWLADQQTAIIEMAAASGLQLVPFEQRDPTITTSYGTGELLHAALNKGARTILIGLGGSATNDGGAGILQALGANLTDRQGKELLFGGSALQQLAHLDLSGLDPRWQQVSLTVLCDVDNPLCGPQGASAIFGPQKGADPQQVQVLDQALTHYGSLLEKVTGRSICHYPGAGAAGGAAAVLLGVLNAQLQPGIDVIMQLLEFHQALAGASLLVTGEGRLDSQTLHGKAPFGAAQLARQYNVPVIAIAGCLGEGYQALYQQGIAALFSIINQPETLTDSLSHAQENLQTTARNIAKLWQLGSQWQEKSS